VVHFVVRRFLFAILTPSLMTTGGCALIVNGTQDSVFIESHPPGATVRVDGQAVARTPAKIFLSRRHPQHVTIEKEGFLPEDVLFSRHFDAGWILFDLLLTLGVGIPIDLATGAMWNFNPDRAVVRMRPRP
jgi:hypothetical protein